MAFFARMNPLRAVRDLRFFLSQRQPHELWFLLAAIGITAFFIYGFVKDSHVARPYKPDIIYVEQWPANRSEAEILAQQKIDQAKKDKDNAELARRQAENQAEFKRLDDRLKRLGI